MIKGVSRKAEEDGIKLVLMTFYKIDQFKKWILLTIAIIAASLFVCPDTISSPSTSAIDNKFYWRKNYD
jgi:hypothetical protein